MTNERSVGADATGADATGAGAAGADAAPGAGGAATSGLRAAAGTPRGPSRSFSPLQTGSTRRTVAGAATQAGTEISINFGSALAGLVLPIVGSFAVVAVRQVVMAIAVVPFYRPTRSLLTWRRLWPAVVLGVVLAVMNVTFYEAIRLLGLGIAATIEFLGPLALALVTSRRLLDVVCALAAGAGVVVLTGLDGRIDLWGVTLALVAAVMWALYIVFTRRVAVGLPGLEGLTVASIVSVALLVPFAVLTFDASAWNVRIVLLLIGVGALSSAIPYSLDTFVLRRIPPRLYSIIASTGPVIAAIFGWLVLSEKLTIVQIAAIALVCLAAGTAVATQRERRHTVLESTAETIR